MILLLALGIAIGAIGLLALGFGIPIKETTFGNSLMLGGSTAIGSGLILIGLAFVLRELKALTAAIHHGAVQGVAVAARAPSAPMLPPLFPKAPAAGDHDPAQAHPAEPVLPPPANTQPASPPPWATEAAARGRAPAPAAETEAPPDHAGPAPGEPPPLAPLVMPPRPKRNLLFPSRRKDPPPAVEAAPVLPEPAAVQSPAPVIPPVQPQEPRQEPRMTFDAAWPANGSAAAPAAPPMHPPQPAAPAAEEVTVIKSGVVDGMEYKLYSDGSIEAKMAEGELRFASLEELRTYLAGRS